LGDICIVEFNMPYTLYERNLNRLKTMKTFLNIQRFEKPNLWSA